MSRFRSEVEKASRERCSRIVLALDILEPSKDRLYEKALWVMREASENVCCFKIGIPTVLKLGLSDVSRLVEEAHDMGLPVIMDCKLGDVGHVNRMMAILYFEAGFDALTVNTLVGFEGGLDSVIEESKKRDRGILPLVYMSHKGAEETFGQTVLSKDGTARKMYEVLAERVKLWDIDGIVVGATRPEVIRQVRDIVEPDTPIYSPGVIFQGGSLRDALEAGSTYLIVGRAIYLSENPRGESARLKKILST